MINLNLNYTNTTVSFESLSSSEKKELELNDRVLINRKLILTFDSENVIFISKGDTEIVICADLSRELAKDLRVFAAAIENEYDSLN